MQVSPTQVTVEEYFTNWFNTYKKPSIKPSSANRLETVLKKQIFPGIGMLLMGNVTSDDCQELINNLLESGLSFSVIKKVYDLMNSCFLHATIKKDLQENPMLVVQGPSASNFEAKEVRALTEEEEVQVFQELSKKWTTGKPKYCYKDVFEVMANTGLREGEMVALDWNDIDFDRKTMKVCKTVVMVKERNQQGELTGKCHQEVQYTPKTKSGNRVVPLNKKAIAALLRLQETVRGAPTVMTSQSGARPIVNVLYKQFKRAAERCGIYGVSPHTLRHTFATRLFERGADVKDVSVILGHSSVTVTYNTYIHVIRKREENTVGLLDDNENN